MVSLPPAGLNIDPQSAAISGAVALGALTFPPTRRIITNVGSTVGSVAGATATLVMGAPIAGARFVCGTVETVGHGLTTVGQTATHAIRGGWNVAQSIPGCATAFGLGLVGGSILNLAAYAINGSSLATVILASPFGAPFIGIVLGCALVSVAQSILSGKPDQTGVFGKILGVPVATVSTFLIASTITAVAAPAAAITVGVLAAGAMAVKEVWPEISGAGSHLWGSANSMVGGTLLTAARGLDTLIAPIETLGRRLVPWVSNETPNARLASWVRNAGASFSRRAS